MIDGVHNVEPLNAFISITPPLDSIESFKVETSNPNAEYGSFGGAIVNLVIKSGTTPFTGKSSSSYVMRIWMPEISLRNASPYKSNQFGGLFGGPIIKNKLFFFADYQQLIAHQGQTNILTVPTALQRQGVLTEGSQGPIYNPTTGAPFPNNTIPMSLMDPVA